MSQAGYSGTPLLKKLGIAPGQRLLLLNAPRDYFELLEFDLTEQLCHTNERPQLVHLFVKNQGEMEVEMKRLKPFIKTNPALVIWVSWYKKSAGIPTDVTEDVIRNFALKNGLVDVKVCALSDIWSGLKLVVPLKLRK